MKTILSVDVDFLFPTHLYNCHIDCDVDYKASWDIIKARTGRKDYEHNEGAYQWLLKVLTNCTKKGTKVTIIQEHDEILPIIRNSGLKNAQCINIDAHHDVTYYGDNSQLNIENWVLYARSEDLVKDYTWIHHDASDMLLDKPFKMTHSSFKDFDPEWFKDLEVEHIVICLSKHFTPIEYHYLPMELQAHCWEAQHEVL